MDKEFFLQIGRTVKMEEWTEQNFQKILYDDVVFFSLAEWGAMGCPGEVIVVTKHKNTVKWYRFNTMNDDEEMLYAIFPPLETFECRMFGKVKGIQEGWHYVDLGVGNHLFVRDDYYAAFQREIDGLYAQYESEIYASWAGIAQLLLTAKENIICFETLNITRAETDCIVNAANETLLGGGGIDAAVHKAAGPELLEECRTLNGCETGEAKITKGYRLKADYIIHTVGPRYKGEPDDSKLLRKCYWNSLELARENDIHSIAFPAISTGVFKFPLKDATLVALRTVSEWLKVNKNYGMTVVFACYDDETTDLYRSIWEENVDSWNERPISVKALH